MKMPISEDEYDHRIHSTIPHQPQPGLSKAEQRRSNKPIMEKRRRARINHCLNELKSLILDAMKKDPARHSKLEKADILEMTVKHLQTIQRQQLTASIAADPSVLQKFKTGFNECAGEVSRYIGHMEGVDTSVKQRLVSHLATCVSGLQQMAPFSFPAASNNNIFNAAFNNSNNNNNNNSNNGNILQQPASSITEDVNNNHASARLQMMTGLQLIPSRLPTGELALLLPNSQQLAGSVLPFFTAAAAQENNANLVSTTTSSSAAENLSSSTAVGNNFIDHSHHSSAFTAVNRKPQHVSPLLSPVSSTASSYNDESTSDQPYPSPSEVTSTSEHQPTSKIKFSKNEKFFPSAATTADETSKQSKTLLHPQPALAAMNLNFESVKKKEPLATNQSLVNSIQTPLKVITTDHFLKIPETSSSVSTNYLSSHRVAEESSQDSLYKNPLDFSMNNKEQQQQQHSHSFLSGMKRSFYSENSTDRLLIKSSDVLCYDLKKIPRLNAETDDKPLSGEKKAKRKDEESSSNSRPSTSTGEVTKDMWRPW